MSEHTIIPANLRGFIGELKMQIELLSDRAANLAARLAAANEQAELHLARIRGLEEELARARNEDPEAPP